MKKVRLNSALRYHYKGTLYEAGTIYGMKDHLADDLLRKQDTMIGVPYFVEVTPELVRAEKAQVAPPPPKPKTEAELEAELEASGEDAIVVAEETIVEPFIDQEIISSPDDNIIT